MKQRTIAVLVLVAATFLPRLTGLGSVLTTDEPLWLGRSDVFLKALATLNFERTATSIQPGVTTTWIGAAASAFGGVAAAQAGVGIASGILVLLITYFLIRLWGWSAGMVGGAVLALDPFLVAHSRLLHTDALLALLVLLSILSLLAAFDSRSPQPQRRYIVLSGVAFALAVLTKIFALAAAPAAAATIAYAAWTRDKRLSRVFQYGVLWAATVTIIAFAAWPALWVSPVQTVRYVLGGITQYSSGTRVEEATAEWWYYARDGFFRMSAPITILAAAGIALACTSHLRSMRTSVFTLAAAGVLYAVILSLRGEKSDRYILFTLLTVDLVAVFGLTALKNLAQRFPYGIRAAAPWLPVALLVMLAATNIRLHPYYLAHYNRFYPIEVDHKLGWGEGLEQAAHYMEAHHPGAEVASYYSTVFSHFYRSGPTVGLTGDTNADYLILYRSMFERGPAHPDTDLSQQYIFSGRYQPEYVITINGLPYVWIFRNE